MERTGAQHKLQEKLLHHTSGRNDRSRIGSRYLYPRLKAHTTQMHEYSKAGFVMSASIFQHSAASQAGRNPRGDKRNGPTYFAPGIVGVLDSRYPRVECVARVSVPSGTRRTQKENTQGIHV